MSLAAQEPRVSVWVQRHPIPQDSRRRPEPGATAAQTCVSHGRIRATPARPRVGPRRRAGSARREWAAVVQRRPGPLGSPRLRRQLTCPDFPQTQAMHETGRGRTQQTPPQTHSSNRSRSGRSPSHLPSGHVLGLSPSHGAQGGLRVPWGLTALLRGGIATPRPPRRAPSPHTPRLQKDRSRSRSDSLMCLLRA